MHLKNDCTEHTDSSFVWWRCSRGHSWCTRSRHPISCPKCREEEFDKTWRHQMKSDLQNDL